MAARSARPPLESAVSLVKAVDQGNRDSSGLGAIVIFTLALAWSLTQLWYASPLPFVTGVGLINDAEARSIHLAFAVALGFLTYPAWPSAAVRVPLIDWFLALLGAGTAAYLCAFYGSLATRAGQPGAIDVIVGSLGLLLLMEATRRAMGAILVVVAVVFVAYSALGPLMPEVVQHRGASWTRIVEQQWLATEGVFGVPLGVSASFVFLYVLFGALLDKAGAGNYIMQLSMALLGHLRGGPAKVAVVSSALNGVISGSTIANVVSGGVFTIPMMKRVGFSGVKAGAIETAASINGQIMPPVMGAAAFIMVEYVGIPYSEVIRHAALPAIISYIALLFIVHTEAVKLDTPMLQPFAVRTGRERIVRHAVGWSGAIAAVCLVYYGIVGIRAIVGAHAGLVLLGVAALAYVALLAFSAQFPDLPPDDPKIAVVTLPEGWAVARTGVHLLIPIGILIWCLMFEEMSPGTAAFWATVAAAAVILTQRPLLALFRRQADVGDATRRGAMELVDGLVIGARNMTGVALACATAGIIVGTVTLTGLGLMMTDLIEVVSGGNLYLVLILTALVTLVLGCGVPTTASYILVATLMAPVIVELGAEAGVAIPLIAIHLFVFYFGIMADVTPPVGLGAYAAAAIAGEDPIATCIQGAIYSLRTALLAFVFIFNPQLLLIDIGNWWQAAIVIVGSTIGCLAFAAAAMNFWITQSRLWESAALLLISLVLLHPNAWLDLRYDRHRTLSPASIEEASRTLGAGDRLILLFEGVTIDGQPTRRTVSLRLGTGSTAAEKLQGSGLSLIGSGDSRRISAVRFGSYGAKLKLEPGFKVVAVLVPAERPSPIPLYALALLAVGGIGYLQFRRARRRTTAPSRSVAAATIER